jgi:hypothetical protein
MTLLIPIAFVYLQLQVSFVSIKLLGDHLDSNFSVHKSHKEDHERTKTPPTIFKLNSVELFIHQASPISFFREPTGPHSRDTN